MGGNVKPLPASSCLCGCLFSLNLLCALHLHADRPQLACADILQGVRRQRPGPQGTLQRNLPGDATVPHRCSLPIATHEVAPAQDIQGTRPSMGVKRNCLSRRYPCIKHTHKLILKQERMILRCRVQRVKHIRPVWLVQHERNSTSVQNSPNFRYRFRRNIVTMRRQPCYIAPHAVQTRIHDRRNPA